MNAPADSQSRLLAQLAEEKPHRLEHLRAKDGFVCDMDGVIYHGNRLLPGVKEFVAWLRANNKRFLFLTNNSAPTPKELRQKLLRLGVDIEEDRFYTSAMATAQFLESQKQNGTVYVIGEPGLHLALYQAGFIMNDVSPDFVVVGEGTSLNYEKIARAVDLVHKGARLIATNPDVNGPSEHGLVPACGAFVSTIELATGKKAFFCGKPSALMMRYAQKILGTSREKTCIIGDRMDTDIIAGVLSEIDPILVLSGVTKIEDLGSFAYRPYLVLEGVTEIPTDGSGGAESDPSSSQQTKKQKVGESN